MIRSDLVWFLPAILISLFQVKIVWARLPIFKTQDTEISGTYSKLEKLKISCLMSLCYLLFFTQLLYPFLTISSNPPVLLIFRIAGYFLILTGFYISTRAVKLLGVNWTGMSDYRIKKGQKLVTTNIYSLIRHPVYFAVLIEIIGFELLANSWLIVMFAVTGFIFFYNHIKKEERLLEKKFGNKYKVFKKNTKMLIPYIF